MVRDSDVYVKRSASSLRGEVKSNPKLQLSFNPNVAIKLDWRQHATQPPSSIFVNMSRFISAGTDEEPTERDEAWLKAQQDMEAKRVASSEVGKANEGKSLFDTLQANKGDSVLSFLVKQAYATDESG